MTHPIATPWIRLAAIALLAVLLLGAGGVRAHGYIIRAVPDDRSSLERAPARVQYWFSEDLEPAFSSVTVRDQTGAIIAEGGVEARDQTLLSARLPSGLPDGAYRVDLRIAFAGDGHVIAATQSFFVGQAADDTFGLSAEAGIVPLEAAWRALLLAATMTLFGAFVLVNLALVPAWGSAAHREGGLPPRVAARFNAIIIGALTLAALANVAALLQQSAAFFGVPVSQVLAEGLWNTVRVSTRFGDTWTWRMALLAVIAAVHGAGLYYRSTQPGLIAGGWAANIWSTALLLGTWSLASHAPGSQVLPWLALSADWLHGLAVGAWAGGVVALVLILPVALRPLAGEARRLALLAVLRRFSRVATAAVGVVIASGLYSASNWFTTPADAVSSYGVALLVKVGLAALLVGLGAAHHIALNPERFARFGAVAERLQGRFGASLRLESAFALITLGAAAWLSATPPPTPPVISPPPLIAQAALGDRTITLTVAPGGPGVNTYDLQVTRGGAPETAATIETRLALPLRDWRGPWMPADSLGEGLYTAAGGDIDRAGPWWALIAVDGVQTAVPLAVSADSALSRERPLTLAGLLALAALIWAIARVLGPPARRYARQLDTSPAAVAVAVGATLAGIGVVVAGLWITATTADAYAQAALPPPQVINQMLPDADSLQRGEAAFAAACPTWADTRDLRELVERLPRLRDQDLFFAVTRDGWWSLPPCAALDAGAAWDVVNHLRAQESRALEPAAELNAKRNSKKD